MFLIHHLYYLPLPGGDPPGPPFFLHLKMAAADPVWMLEFEYKYLRELQQRLTSQQLSRQRAKHRGDNDEANYYTLLFRQTHTEIIQVRSRIRQLEMYV